MSRFSLLEALVGGGVDQRIAGVVGESDLGVVRVGHGAYLARDAEVTDLELERGPRQVGPDEEQSVGQALLMLEAGEGAANPGTGLHLSFRASSHQDVDLFYETALSLGAKSAGAPGHRPQYTAHFYGAFVIDIDGFKIEATHRHR